MNSMSKFIDKLDEFGYNDINNNNYPYISVTVPHQYAGIVELLASGYHCFELKNNIRYGYSVTLEYEYHEKLDFKES